MNHRAMPTTPTSRARVPAQDLCHDEVARAQTVDTAALLRGLSGLALVRTNYIDAMSEVAELLADRQPVARMAAAQAIGYGERQEVAVPLLRFKALSGDEDAGVLNACLSALLEVAPAGSLDFVGRFVQARSPETREAALLALGGSRIAAALPLLVRAAESMLPVQQRPTAYLAIALHRTDAALDYLLAVVRSGPALASADALTALGTYREDSRLRNRALKAARERGIPRLLERAESLFGPAERRDI